MLLFSVICWEFLAVVRLHLVKLFFPRKTRKKKRVPKSALFSWVVISLAKNSSNWTNMFYKQFTACLSSLSTPTSALTLSLWADLIFFWVHCSREIARRGEIAKSHAVGLKKQFGMGELRSFLVDTFVGDEYPNLYLEPKWPPLWLELRPCFWGVDLQN